MKILVAMDGSEQSRKAVNEAAKIASGFSDVEVHLLNVYESSSLPMYGEDVSVKVREEFKELQTKMKQNPEVNEYMQAQQQFNQILQRVNETISSKLGVQGGCSPGSGCC